MKIEVENHHLSSIAVIMVSLKGHVWMQKSVGESMMETGCLHSLQVSSKDAC